MRDAERTAVRRRGFPLPLALTLPAAVALAVLLPSRLPIVVLPALVLFPSFARDVAAGRLVAAARRTLVWALALSALTIAAVLLFPARMESRVPHGPAYREEMLRWIDTGVGKESEIRAFLPDHALHFSLLLVLSFATGGAAGLLLGAFLLAYMNFYVASLALASSSPAMSLLVGWPIWSVVRVIGFVMAAVGAAGPFYNRFQRIPDDLRRGRSLLVAGAALAVIDVLLKHFTASHWRGLLRWSLGGG